MLYNYLPSETDGGGSDSEPKKNIESDIWNEVYHDAHWGSPAYQKVDRQQTPWAILVDSGY